MYLKFVSVTVKCFWLLEDWQFFKYHRYFSDYFEFLLDNAADFTAFGGNDDNPFTA